MPCTDPDADTDTINDLHRKVQSLTDKLCRACRSAHNGGIKLEGDIEEWWLDHEEKDRRRLQQELDKRRRYEARVAALSKLSAGERELLGL